MIVPMKKIALLVENKDAEFSLRKVRQLGVLHVQHQQLPQGKDTGLLQEDVLLCANALDVINDAQTISKQTSIPPGALPDWKTTARHIIDSQRRLAQLKEYSVTLEQRISQWEAWGDFDPEKLGELEKENIYIKFYQIPLNELKNLPSQLIVKQIFIKAAVANCLVISRSRLEFKFKEMPLPKMGLEKMKARLREDTQRISLIQHHLQEHYSFRPALLAVKKVLEKEIEFSEVLQGMGQMQEINYLTGFVPDDKAQALTRLAQKERWGIWITEPAENDNVPTLIRNPGWVSIISPVFKLLEVIPGYRELDISPLFLCFLSLFFGMIIGDAGYGIVYILLTFWFHKRLGKKIKDQRVFFLFYTFSACTVFWGLLTGTFFGQEWFVKAGFKPITPILNDTKFLQAFCFFLGAFHLSLAHAWQAIRKWPSLSALVDAGWILILWAAFFLAKNLILNDPVPVFEKWLIVLGLSLVVLFTSPQRNIFKMIGAGLGTIALSLVNNFTDVVSYIRLFAVGLAGVAIADTVNTLAAGFSGNPLAAGIIVFIGHTINIILGPMSVLVHGIRLNVLEFSSHANLSWSGVAYKPLQE
jgi:V/A-type H+-transporting ATPase subunit I